MGTRKKFWVGFGALAMIAVMTFTSIGLTWAAVTLNVNSEFSVSYTAKKVNAIISGKYITGSTSGSLGEDLTFSADTKDTTKAFANVPVVKFVSATDFLELQFTIRNTGEDGFGVKLSLTGAEDSNFSVKYSKSYRSSTATPATFGAENGKSSLSNMYVTSVTTAKSVLWKSM